MLAEYFCSSLYIESKFLFIRYFITLALEYSINRSRFLSYPLAKSTFFEHQHKHKVILIVAYYKININWSYFTFLIIIVINDFYKTFIFVTNNKILLWSCAVYRQTFVYILCLISLLKTSSFSISSYEENISS